MKSIFLLLCLLCSFPFYGQKNFDSKKKTVKPQKSTSEFQTIDGSRTPYARKSSSGISQVKLSEQRFYKAVSSPEDPSFIHIENLKPESNNSKGKATLQSKAFAFLEDVKEYLPIKDNLADALKIIETQNDEYGNQHLKLIQSFKGVPVYGGELMLHTRESEVVSLNGHLVNLENFKNSEPKLTESEAIEMAKNDLRKITTVQDQGLTGGLLKLQQNTSTLLIFTTNDHTPKLAYELVVRPNILERWVYFIDAISGDVLEKYNHTCTLDGVFSTRAVDLNGIQQSFVIYQKGENYFMVDPSKKMFDNTRSTLPDSPKGAVWTIDARNGKINDNNLSLAHVSSADGLDWSRTAVSAHNNASICYNYFEKTFNRNSLNGNGGNIVSVINITDEDGTGLDNAYWNGEFMGYGNGNQAFKPLAGGLDVAGHEMTHGVIENTAKLEYRNQSGALNESLADIFGVLIDRDDWTLGEDIVKTSVFRSGAMRSLSNPNQNGKSDNGYQPKNMSQYEFLKDTPSQDNGGVHINSGIPNHAFYLFATGTGMNKEKAEKVYYQAMTKYLTRTSKFLDMRVAVIQSATDIYGNGSEVAAAKVAFDAVGITESNTNTTPAPTPESQVIPINPGKQFLVVYEPVGKSIYAGPADDEAAFVIVSNGLGCKKKPTITDNGTRMFFVADNGNIYLKDLTTTAAPQAITTTGDWDNVAISKNGKLLAALKLSEEPFLYVFDLVNQKNIRFQLYNPTYTQGVSTGEVLYADSFEWDYTGEFIIYDAFNRAGGVFGNIEYWDVGIIKAWDNSTNSFAEGTIEKIFSDLEDGDNIGNPAISKTNPNIIAFDYFNSNEEELYVLGVDLSRGDIGAIVQNNTIGFPDYSANDKILAYNSELTNGDEVVRIIGLNDDRITATTTSGQRLFGSGQDKWVVFYAQGVRTLPQKEAQTISFDAITDKQRGERFTVNATASSRLAVQYSIVGGDASINANQITCGSSPGKVTVEALQVGNASFSAASVQSDFCIVPPPPSLTLNGFIATAQGGDLFQWYINGREIGARTSKNTFNTADFVGSYTVRTFTTDGCGSAFSISVAGQAPLGLPQEKAIELEVYPNPTSNLLSLKINNGSQFQKVTVFNILGQKVAESSTPELEVSNLMSGVYTLTVLTSETELQGKFVKQ